MYELQRELMLEHGQEVTSSWLPLFAAGRYYIPSADFSCMISEEMFSGFFLKEIINEVNWLDRSVYHLDGPGAVRHLDALLQIEKLDAIQFVCGAGQNALDWIHVFQRIQAAGKNIQVHLAPAEIPQFTRALRPEGVMITTCAASIEDADALIKFAAKWR
jgi:hypothetical protein